MFYLLYLLQRRQWQQLCLKNKKHPRPRNLNVTGTEYIQLGLRGSTLLDCKNAARLNQYTFTAPKRLHPPLPSCTVTAR
mgnify:CR=1 FL=1